MEEPFARVRKHSFSPFCCGVSGDLSANSFQRNLSSESCSWDSQLFFVARQRKKINLLFPKQWCCSPFITLMPALHGCCWSTWSAMILFSSVAIKTAFQTIVLIKTNVSLLSNAPGNYSSSFSHYLVSSKWDVSNLKIADMVHSKCCHPGEAGEQCYISLSLLYRNRL